MHDVCADYVIFIFTFVVVSFFVERGARDGQNSAKIIEGVRGEKSSGNHCAILQITGQFN